MSSVDKITASIIQRRLFFINEEMGEAMLRTACSQILNASRDFSTGMFDGAGRLISPKFPGILGPNRGQVIELDRRMSGGEGNIVPM